MRPVVCVEIHQRLIGLEQVEHRGQADARLERDDAIEPVLSLSGDVIDTLSQPLRGFILATGHETPLSSERDFRIRGHRDCHGRGERRY